MRTEEQKKLTEEYVAQGKTDSAVLHGQSAPKSKSKVSSKSQKPAEKKASPSADKKSKK